MKYIYKDKNGEQEFTATKPKDCRMELSKDGYTAIISIHAATNKFREDLDGWGSDHNTLNGALDSACRRILEKSARQSAEKHLFRDGRVLRQTKEWKGWRYRVTIPRLPSIPITPRLL